MKRKHTHTHKIEDQIKANYSFVQVQWCPTLCNPMDSSWPDFSVPGIFQASILQWFAIFSFRESSQLRDQNHVF